MRRLFLLVFILLAGFFVAGFKLKAMIAPCLANPNSAEVFHFCIQQSTKVEPVVRLLAQVTRHQDLKNLARLLAAGQDFIGHEDYFLGLGQKPTTYLVLLQNDNELRANGGFVGSYAVIELDHGQPSFRFQDIYVPDGQLPDHVEPPFPIQEAFKQGWWKLRDADWYPDFPSSASTIRWFFKEGKEIEPDFLLTFSLQTVKSILDVTGPIEVRDYQLVVDADNVFQVLQSQAEVNFFPGSTQKKDALTAVGQAFLSKLSGLSYTQKLAIGNIILDQLEKQNMLVHATYPPIQAILLEKNWAGKLAPTECGDNCLSDTLAIVETNLGANKANCCTNRLTTHTISLQAEYLVHAATIDYINSSHEENPKPPDFYGGNYIQYLRLYLPEEAVLVTIEAQPSLPTTLAIYPQPYSSTNLQLLARGDNFGFTEYGFFHLTRAGAGSRVTLTYHLPRKDLRTYQLNLIKQSGLHSSPQVIYLADQQLQTDLITDYHLQKKLADF